MLDQVIVDGQRVGIACVLYQQPDLILADEPVSALDPTLADEAVGALVAASEASGATLVASLHAVDLALKWFPRLIGMRDGEVVFDRPTAAVTTTMLHELYATEGRALPVQGVEAAPSATHKPCQSRSRRVAFLRLSGLTERPQTTCSISLQEATHDLAACRIRLRLSNHPVRPALHDDLSPTQPE